MHIDTTIVLHWPQYVWLACAAASLVVNAMLHGRPRGGAYNTGVSAISTALIAALLYYGGFFAGATP